MRKREKERDGGSENMYLTMQSTYYIYSYIVSNIW